MTLNELNALGVDAFVARIGWVFEHSPWVAEQAWTQRPFDSIDQLLDVMTRVVATAARDRQLALLKAHPDLGARARMSDASTGEQANAGLDRLTREDFDRLVRLNSAYRSKFGFPFLYAVKGSGPAEILAALERRLDADAPAEFEEALQQVYRIAGFRVRDTIS